MEVESASPSMEALERKRRSISRLKNESVPTIEHLPVIEDSMTAKLRSREEIATRAIATCLTAVKGEGLEQSVIDSVVKEYQAEEFFSPKETVFIQDATASQIERIQFCWRYECYWVFLWVLGYVERLDRPDRICDVPGAVDILREAGTEKFILDGRARPMSEILDAADLVYRYHWAVVDARLGSRPAPANLDAGVVKERHYALNWLIGYCGQEWDDVTTDT